MAKTDIVKGVLKGAKQILGDLRSGKPAITTAGKASSEFPTTGWRDMQGNPIDLGTPEAPKSAFWEDVAARRAAKKETPGLVSRIGTGIAKQAIVNPVRTTAIGGGLGALGYSFLKPGTPAVDPNATTLTFADFVGGTPTNTSAQSNTFQYVPVAGKEFVGQQSPESLLDNLASAYGLSKKETAQLKADWWAKQLRNQMDVQAQQASDAQKYEFDRKRALLNAAADPGMFTTERAQFAQFFNDPAQRQAMQSAGINSFLDYLNYIS